MPEAQRRGEELPAPSGQVTLGPGLVVDLSKPVADVVPGGVKAFAARWEASGDAAVAMLAIPGRPARQTALDQLTNVEIPDCLAPLRHGVFGLPGGEYAVVIPPPRGAPVLRRGSRIAPWTEDAVLQEFMRPVARALVAMQSRGVTHRGIRPDNVFLVPGQPGVVLGEAWIAPPGGFQPAWVEPLGSAACDPDGRGEGTHADDIFALGAATIALLQGHVPEESDAKVVRLRLERGSFPALAGHMRLSSRMADLLRSMLSDEPLQRPNADAVVQISLGAAVRRVVSRPIRRAARPFESRGEAMWDPRSLAQFLASDWAHAIRLVETPEVENWVRRVLSDTLAAAKLEAIRIERSRSNGGGAERLTEDAALMRMIAVLDPTAPIAWRGQRFLPGGMAGQAAASLAAGEERSADFLAFLQAGGAGTWLSAISEIEGEKLSADRSMREIRTLALTAPPVGGIRRLAHQLNPLLGVRSPLLRDQAAHGIGPMLKALDRSAALGTLPEPFALDVDLIAFVAAIGRGTLDGELKPASGLSQAAEAGRLLRLTAILQRETNPGPLPALAHALLRGVQPLLQTYKSKERRKTIAEDLEKLADGGMIDALLLRIENVADRQADAAGFAQAEAQAAVLRARLKLLDEQRPHRRERALQLGADIASGLGWIGVVAATFSMIAS